MDLVTPLRFVATLGEPKKSRRRIAFGADLHVDKFGAARLAVCFVEQMLAARCWSLEAKNGHPEFEAQTSLRFAIKKTSN